MDNVQKVTNYGFKRGMVFCDGNLSVQVTVTYLPIYMLMFLKIITRITNMSISWILEAFRN